jgi:tetratricopeptide (TPR) repeat protein
MLPPPQMLTIKFRWFGPLLLLALLAGCTPSGPRALLQGKRLLEQERYPDAIEKLKTATVLLGTNALACAQAWNYLGVAYQHARDPLNAGKAYQKAYALNPDLAEAHYNLGCLLLSENKLEPARGEFTAYTLRRGNSPDGFIKLGGVQLRTRDTAAADKSFNDALRLSPQNPEALNGLGLVRVQQRRPAEAVQLFSSALKVDPDNRSALLNFAIVQQNYLRDKNAALAKYREYLALKPAPANAAAIAEIVRELEQENAAQARAAVVPNPVTNPGPPIARSAPAPTPAARTVTSGPERAPNVAAETKPQPNPPSVRAAAPANHPVPGPSASPPPEVTRVAPEPVIKVAPDVAPPPAVKAAPARAVEPTVTTTPPPAVAASPKPAKHGFLDTINPVNLFRGSEKAPTRTTPLPAATSSNGPQSGATASAGESVRPVPRATFYPRYRYLAPAVPAAGDRAAAQKACDQAIQAYRDHRVTEAAQYYRQATQLDPSFFEAQYNYGLAATDIGALPAALVAYENALALRPDSGDARYNFALVLKQARYYNDAANELEKLATSQPNETRAHLALANLYAQQLAQPALAREQYLKVLELEPKNPQASAIRFWLSSNPQ